METVTVDNTVIILEKTSRTKAKAIEYLVRILNRLTEGKRYYPPFYMFEEIYKELKRESPELYETILSRYPKDVVEKVDKVVELVPLLSKVNADLRRRSDFWAPFLDAVTIPEDKELRVSVYVEPVYDECYWKVREELGIEYEDDPRKFGRAIIECIENFVRPSLKKVFGDKAKFECRGIVRPRCHAYIEIE